MLIIIGYLGLILFYIGIKRGWYREMLDILNDTEETRSIKKERQEADKA